MTIEEFDNFSFGNKDRVKYKEEYYPVRKVDFEERLLGILMDDEDTDEISWVRCENVTLVKHG